MSFPWMFVKEYDFNNGTGHFSVKAESVTGPNGRRWPDVGDEMILATVETEEESFGCVVTVTKVDVSVRDGYLRYETDLAPRFMRERRARDRAT